MTIYEWTETEHMVKLEVKDNNEFTPKLVAKAHLKYGAMVEILIHDKYVTSYEDEKFNKENAKIMIVNMIIYHLLHSFNGKYTKEELQIVKEHINREWELDDK